MFFLFFIIFFSISQKFTWGRDSSTRWFAGSGETKTFTSHLENMWKKHVKSLIYSVDRQWGFSKTNNPGINIPFVSQNMKNQFRKHTDLFFAPDLPQIYSHKY